MKNLSLRRPSASMVVAVAALILAASGTAVAASKLINGDKLIKKGSLSGNRIRNHSITGSQMNLSKLGKVPSAGSADRATLATSATNASHANNADNATNASHASSADNAAHATNADNAANATTLNGQSGGNFLTTSSRIGTNGIVKEAGVPPPGNTVTLFTVGPFTVTMQCTKQAGGTSADFSFSSTEPNSVLAGLVVPGANTPTDSSSTNDNVDVSPTTSPGFNDDTVVDFEAPSGAQAQLDVSNGVNSLNTDCWANWVGIH